MLHLMLLTAYILINHLDNCARPSKCLNDQGGINADGKGWTDQNSDSRTGKVKFGITFNTKPIIVLPTCRIKYSKTESPVVVNVIHTSLNNSGFEYNADEVSGGEQSRTLEYIAIGI